MILADISQIEVGQEIFALGNPRGLEGTISPGIISGMNFREVDGENLIQITAPISGGSSGGPVVNQKGEVIGVASASFRERQNLNFAVPSSYLAILLANSKNVTPLVVGPPSPTAKEASSIPSYVLEPTSHSWTKYSEQDASKSVFYFDKNLIHLMDGGRLVVWEQTRDNKDKSLKSESLIEIDCSKQMSQWLRFFPYRDGVRMSASDDLPSGGTWKFYPPKTVGGALISKVCAIYY